MRTIALLTILICLSINVVQCKTGEGETYTPGATANVNHTTESDGTTNTKIDIRDGGNSKEGFDFGFDEYGNPYLKNSGSARLTSLINFQQAKAFGWGFIVLSIISGGLIWGLGFRLLSTTGTIMAFVLGMLNLTAMEYIVPLIGNALIPIFELFVIIMCFVSGSPSNFFREMKIKKELQND